MKYTKTAISFISVSILIILFSVNSCRKEVNFEEIDNFVNDTSVGMITRIGQIKGSIAMPLVNTRFTITSYLPETDSTFWMEIDDNDMAHFRMYLTMNEYSSSDLFSHINYPAPTGFVVPAFTKQLRTDTTKIKLYANALAGRLFFADPKITIKVSNSIPLVTYFKLDTLTFYDDDNNSLSNTSNTSYQIDAPLTKGEIKTKDILIDKNSMPELPEVFSPIPKTTSFLLTIGSETNQALPFELDGSEKIKIDADIDLPLDARLVDFAMGDTIPFVIDDDIEQITSATLKIELENGFPFDALTQIYFADSTATGEIGTMIDSLFTDTSNDNISEKGWLLSPPDVDNNGIVTGSTKTLITLKIDSERLEKLNKNKSSFIVIKTKFNTYKSGDPDKMFIKIYSYYKMGVKIGIKVDYKNQ